MASPHSNQPPAEINVAYLLACLWSAKFAVLLFVAIVTGLTYLFTQIAEPQYEAEAQLLIETQETAFTRPEVEDALNIQQLDERDIASEVQVLRSRDVALQVIDQLGLADLEEFDPVLEGVSLVKSVMVLLGLSEDPLRLSQAERVYQEFDDGLSVYNIPDSRVVVVVYESSDPELSARIINTLIDTYQATQRAAQVTTTRSATDFLETEINQLRQQVADAEAAVARFRSSSGLFLGPNNTTLSAQQLSETSSELTRARSDQSEARSRAQEIRSLIASQGTQIALPQEFSTALTERLQEEQAQIRSNIAELSATLLPGHPRIRELNAQSGDLGTQLRDEASRIAQRFDNAAQVAEARAQALEDQLAQLSAEAARVADAEVELRALEREAAAQRDLLQSYLVRFREAATRDEPSLLPTNARVIQTAQIEREAVFPRTMPMIMIAFAGSFAFALLGVTSHAILSGAVREDPVDAYEQQPPYESAVSPAPRANQFEGPAPTRDVSELQFSNQLELSDSLEDPAPRAEADRTAQRIAAAAAGAGRTRPSSPVQPVAAPAVPSAMTIDPDTASADIARPLVSELQTPPGPPASVPATYALADPSDCRRLFSHLRTIGLGAEDGLRTTVGAADTSHTAGEIALRLARATAQAGRSVVMIDCVGDLRALGMGPNGPGFQELVTGSVAFDAALHKDPKSSLHIVPGGFTLADRDMIADDAADLVFSAFASSYDSVIVNAGRDAQLLLECARINDCMVLGGRANRVAALAQTLSALVPEDRMIAVQMPQPTPSPFTVSPAAAQ